MAYTKRKKTTRRRPARSSAGRTSRPRRKYAKPRAPAPRGQTLRIVIENGEAGPDPVQRMMTPHTPGRAKY